MCIQLGCSQGVDLFALEFYLERVVANQPFLASENRDTGLPDDEDRILLRPLVLAQCRSVTDRRTDFQRQSCSSSAIN